MKKVKLIIDGKEFNVELSDEQIQDLTKIKMGYERVEEGGEFYCIFPSGVSKCMKDQGMFLTNILYDNANYYSDKTIAENNARADKLYRQLRRFAVEHREGKIEWNADNTIKYCIYYSHISKNIEIGRHSSYQYFGKIYFDTEGADALAINTFKDELLWYFTEYKDSL